MVETCLIRLRVNLPEEAVKVLTKFVNKVVGLVSTSTLLIGLLASIPITFSLQNAAQAVNPTCISTMTAQNGLKAVPAHGKVFYIDSGVVPKVDAAYVGYRIENSSGSTKTGLWVSIETFIGGKLSLANPLDQYQQMDPITNTNYKTAFYLLKANGSTTVAQTHTIKVFDRRPDLTGATAVLTCDFSFSQIQETIKANANKVTSVSGALSPATATLGGTLTVSVAGNTGKVGSGKTPDFSIIWVSPAAVSTWPTRSLRLESTSITLNCSNPLPNITLVDTLLQSTADTSCFTNAGSWTGTYVFRIIGPGPSSLTPSPVANIASGTQYKHSDINGLSFGTGIDLSGVATSTFTVNVTASSTVVSSDSSTAIVRYTITLSTTSTTSVEVDEVIDRPAAGTTLVTGSSKLNGASISDPSVLASEASLTPPPVHYIGPFSVVSGTNVVIIFDRSIPCSNVSTPYSNTAYAKTGDQILGSGTTTIPGVTVTTLTSDASSCGVTITNNPQTIAPTVQTSAATSVTSSTAVLNGFANAYGQSGVTTYFKYSTDRNLVVSVTNTASTSLTGTANQTRTASISGLSPGTLYFFQAVVTSGAGTATGATLSFTTDFVQAVPTVVTTAASLVATTSATLNGYVNPNLTSVTKVQFIFGTTSASVTGESSSTLCTSNNKSNSPCVIQVDDGTGALTDLTLTGSGQTGVSFNVSSLTSGVTYYFKLQVLCTTDTTYCPGGSVSGNVLQFKTGAPQVITTDATLVAETTATINGSMSSTGNNIKHQFYYCAAAAGCTASTLSGGSTVGTSSTVTDPFNSTITHNLTGLTGNTTYYYQAQGIVGTDVVSYGEILSFRTILITTSSLPGGTLGASYTTGLSGSGGVGPYTWSSTSLPAGLTLSSTGVISGTPTSGGTTSVTFTMRDDYYGTTTTKALSIVVKASVTYALDGGSGTLPTEVNHSSGETFAVAAFTGLTKTGYTLTSWSDGTSTYSAGATYTMGSANVTLTAQWTINTYTLTYNGNGNTAGDTPTAVTQNYNTTILVDTGTGLAKISGGITFIFGGWNTAANGSGTNYAVGSTFTFTENRTLYARWTDPGSKTVTFNSNFGTSITSSQSADTSTALTSNSFSRTGYTFSGWGTDSSTATIDYANNATYNFLADITLYAKWTINSYTLTYVAGANGGIAYGGSTGTPKTQSVNYLGNGAAVVATPNTGYSFVSWNDGNTSATRTDLSITQSDTYTATFAINSYLITFNANGGSGGSSISLNYNVDAIPSKPSDPTRTDYTFGGWSLDGNTPALTSYTVTGNATLFAIWTANAVTYSITYATTSSDGGSAPGDTTGNGSVTLATNSGNLTRSGYTFNGWNTGTNCSGTNYSAGATYNLTASVTLYPCWSQNSTTPAPTQPPAPITIPRPPAITSVSASDVCAVGSQLVISGVNLVGSSVLFEGIPLIILSSTNTSIVVALPANPVGVKQIVVRNSDGMAAATVEYKFIETPVYVNYVYPSTYQGMNFTYTFEATNTERYILDGVMPKGLTLNTQTGEVSGIPTVTGNFKFTIIAANLCDQTYLDVYMFVDKAIPQTYSCSVSFPVARSNTILSSKLVQLRNCLDDIYVLSPATISPVIFISGGLPAGLTIEQSLTHPRYLPILEVINSMKLGAQIYMGAFNGSTDLVQLIVYWPQP